MAPVGLHITMSGGRVQGGEVFGGHPDDQTALLGSVVRTRDGSNILTGYHMIHI